jgi:hypothetical protein
MWWNAWALMRKIEDIDAHRERLRLEKGTAISRRSTQQQIAKSVAT